VPPLRNTLNSALHRLDGVMHTPSGRRAFLTFIAVAIGLVTLRPGDGGSSSTFCILCGERGLSDFLANVILFLPLGIALAVGGRRFLPAVLLGLLFSVFIEFAQWRVISGRDASIGDLVSNTTGAALGWLLFAWKPWRIHRRRHAHAYVTAVVTALVLLGALSLFTPNFFRDVYWLHWTPDYESLENYHGKVLRTSVGNRVWTEQQKLPFPDSVAHLIVSAPLEARVVVGPEPRTLAPIVSISDQVQEEVILIGAEGSDLVYRFRARANDILLDHANLRAPNAFRGVKPGDTVDLAVSFKRKGYCIGLNENVSCGRGFTVGQTWSLLVSPNLSTTLHQLISFFWLILVFVPAGFVASTRSLLIGSIAITTVFLLAGPLLIGFAMTPVVELAAAFLGLLIGHALAGVSFFKS
jgi:hypothetical protein